jgi:FkbM family methyltransferase
MSQFDTPKKRTLIYDVGLHQGEDSEFYLRKGFNVVAFEADPDLAASCRKRLAKYLDNQQLQIIEGAIVADECVAGDQKKIKFYKSGVSVWGTVNADWALRNEKIGARSEEIEVAVVNFKEAIQQFGVPYYMKIDIEGSDLVCLEALRGFSEKPDYVSIESEMAQFGDLEKEISLLEELGYTDFLAVQQEGIEGVLPPRPASEGDYVAYEFPPGSTGLFGKELGEEWKSKEEILAQFRRIHQLHAIFSGFSERGLNRNWVGSKICNLIKRIVRKPLPGWYDTHARHKSAAN